MFDDEMKDFERIGERAGNSGEDEENAQAAEWKEQMEGEDVPEFAGEWSYGPGESEAAGQEDEAAEGYAGESEHGLGENEGEVGEANKLVDYGFDTVSRLYGLNTVLQTIVETDEDGRDADNPLGSIYERIVPDADARAQLFREIQKESPTVNKSKLGMTETGEFYDEQIEETGDQESVDAIRALRRLIEILENSERFAKVRERAAEQGKTIVEYLVGDQMNPSLSDFLEKVGAEMSEEEVEEIVEELEEQVNPEAKEDEDAEESEFGA